MNISYCIKIKIMNFVVDKLEKGITLLKFTKDLIIN